LIPDIQIKTAIPGQKVRIIWPPFAGSQGTIISIDGNPTLLPSGVSCQCALVELVNKKIKVPLTNLEAI
jgi:transcription antitermination factor NusG